VAHSKSLPYLYAKQKQIVSNTTNDKEVTDGKVSLNAPHDEAPIDPRTTPSFRPLPLRDPPESRRGPSSEWRLGVPRRGMTTEGWVWNPMDGKTARVRACEVMTIWGEDEARIEREAQ